MMQPSETYATSTLKLEWYYETMETTNAYDTCLDTMYALGRFGIVLGLSTIEGILENLDNPQNDFISIHIAGTNGKGSVASTLSSILHTAGYRTGLYTSPHLVKFNERICIDNTQVTDNEVVELYNAVKDADNGERQATFFEITTAMALYEFSRKKLILQLSKPAWAAGWMPQTFSTRPCPSSPISASSTNHTWATPSRRLPVKRGNHQTEDPCGHRRPPEKRLECH